ncbi:MAG: ferrochelatase [Opitutales bacterium]|nr:ferrochelatase [Opitutales bacterium]
MSKEAALLINLGSPDSTEVRDVRRYLAEFLGDERVIDVAWVRKVIVPGIILNTRPKKSAEAYASIWTDKGSPLMVTSYRQRDLLRERTEIPVELAMRYGSPSIPDVLKSLLDSGVQRLFVLPLYPHYAMSSYETVVVKVMEVVNDLRPELDIEFLQPFYKDSDYVDALWESARAHLEDADYDRLLFSFHGIPERHLRLSDPSHAHCLCTHDCCRSPNPAHATCYRHQCLVTVDAFLAKSGIPPEKAFVSFQSRLGRDPWLRPYTDETLKQWGEAGVGSVKVICPAFVSDCLETLEEIAEEGKEIFEEAGGGHFELIPCMNERPRWINMLAGRIETWRKHPARKPVLTV